jgi:hypothetical protein
VMGGDLRGRDHLVSRGRSRRPRHPPCRRGGPDVESGVLEPSADDRDAAPRTRTSPRWSMLSPSARPRGSPRCTGRVEQERARCSRSRGVRPLSPRMTRVFQ